MKKFYVVILAVIMVACMFTACRATSPVHNSEKNEEIDDVVVADLAPIPGYNYLYYSLTERTVYYLFDMGIGQAKTGYMCEYIRNGHNCEYLDGEIMEVIPIVNFEHSNS